MTLRDELAAVLGPGNNDLIAYEQADTVIRIVNKWDAEHSQDDSAWDTAVVRVQEAFPVWLLSSLPRLSSNLLLEIVEVADKTLDERNVIGRIK